MPCTDASADDYRRDRTRAHGVSVLTDRLDRATRLLCTVLRAREEAGEPIEGELADWWAEHKAQDAQAGR